MLGCGKSSATIRFVLDKLSLLLVVIFITSQGAIADGTDIKKVSQPPAPQKEDTSRFEITPWIKKIDITQNSGVLRVIVKASAATECYKQREIERIFEKNLVKIVLRLKRAPNSKECKTTKLFDYEEKIYESPSDLAPNEIWVLGYEGWHKLKVN